MDGRLERPQEHARPQAPPRAKKLEYLKAAAENVPGPIREMLQGGHWLDEVRNDDRQNPLHVAALEGSEDVAAVLLRCPRVVKRLDAHDCALRTPLHLAAAMGFPGIASRLVKAGASLNLKDEKGNTPVVLAVQFEWADTVRLLLDAGANPLVENYQGQNAVDVANARQDVECATLLAAAARAEARGRAAAPLGGLARCLLPQWRPKPPPIPDDVLADHALKQQQRPTLDAAAQESSSPANRPTSPGPREAAHRELTQASLEIGEKSRKDDDCEIEWNGLDPRLVKKGQEGEGAASSPAAEGGEKASWRRKIPGFPEAAAMPIKPPPQAQAPVKPTEAPPPVSPKEGVEYAIFRLQPYFDERVTRLEFEVEWKDEKVAVGIVKPGGEAHKRGFLQGDVIVAIGGVSTFGKGRDELLPLLKQRPLQLKVDREARIQDPDHEPHLEIKLPFGDVASTFQELGLDVQWRGHLPVAAKVKPNSVSWAAGVMEGDALYSVGDRKTVDLGRDPSKLMSALQERPPALSAWRRPLGLDLASNWVLKASR